MSAVEGVLGTKPINRLRVGTSRDRDDSRRNIDSVIESHEGVTEQQIGSACPRSCQEELGIRLGCKEGQLGVNPDRARVVRSTADGVGYKENVIRVSNGIIERDSQERCSVTAEGSSLVSIEYSKGSTTNARCLVVIQPNPRVDSQTCEHVVANGLFSPPASTVNVSAGAKTGELATSGGTLLPGVHHRSASTSPQPLGPAAPA